MAELPDYYAILEVAPTGTVEDIKKAYKKAALKWHPDRVPADSPDRPKRTKMFQRINDAYYTLSDATRRRDYDEARSFQGTADPSDWEDEDADEEIPRSKQKQAGSKGGGSSWANMFGFGGGASGPTQEEQTANAQFSSAFEEMMAEDATREEELNEEEPNRRVPRWFWRIVGGGAGVALGFIVGDFVGAATGGIIGSKAGAIRDAKGKSVYQVFQSLDQDKKAKILTELAAKLFSGAIS